jgi:concanavalin A-like lectin/glucanase superfamily protein
MWVVALAMSAGVAGVAGPARAAADRPVAIWAMNEAAGARTMADSGGRDLTGTVGAEVGVGTDVDGERGYRFARLEPDTPPTHPQHLVMVPASAGLDPGTGDFAVTVRLRTTYQFGNVVQKGQSTVPGGNWKIQIPSGHPQCVFRGSAGTMLASAPAAINDGGWHTVTCLRDAAGLWLAVDGTRVAGRAGHTGRIANTWPLSIGGKSSCDQIDVGCDYYAGDIDYVRIDAGEPDATGQNGGGSGSGANGPGWDDPGWDDAGWDGPGLGDSDWGPPYSDGPDW